MNNFKLHYGKGFLNFAFPADIKINKIEAVPTQALKDLAEHTAGALAEPINSPPLRELVRKGDKVAIIVSDITRLAYRTDAYLPVILNALNELGVPDENITAVIATGMHRAQTPEEDLLVLGKEAYGRIKVENHNCYAPDLVPLGRTSRGTEVFINHTVGEADRVILTGGISYHFIAGFGGARKSITPGVGGYNTIQQNHSWALRDADITGINPGVGTGILDGNPVAEDMMEIAKMFGRAFLVNVVLNEHKEFIAVVAGDVEEAFKAGCRVVEKSFGIPISHKSDLVVVSCGGYPKDIQLYQAVKALDNAAYAVKKGGVIIFCAECSDGSGSDAFMEWFDERPLAKMSGQLRDKFAMPGFVALRTASICEMAHVIFIGSLPPDDVKRVGMIPVSTPGEAWAKAQELLGRIEDITMMPQGFLTFPIYRE